VGRRHVQQRQGHVAEAVKCQHSGHAQRQHRPAQPARLSGCFFQHWSWRSHARFDWEPFGA
jgi:hypothetical protein